MSIFEKLVVAYALVPVIFAILGFAFIIIINRISNKRK